MHQTFAPRLHPRRLWLAGVFASTFLLAPLASQDPSTPSKPEPDPNSEAPQTPQEPTAQRPSRLPEVIITESEDRASRIVDGTPIDNTAGRDVLTPAEILEAGAMNVQELLRRSPSIFVVEESGSDSLPNIAVRGLTGSSGGHRSVNISLLADGIPLAPAPYGHPGNSLFPMTMERVYAIDIQRGGSSVRYGPNNVGGTINFLTRPIPEQTMIEQRIRYDTFNDVSSYTALGTTEGPFGVLVEAVYKDGETYRDHGDYELQNYSLKTSYQFSETVRGLFQVEYYEDDSDLSDGLRLADYLADPEQSTALQNKHYGEQWRTNYKLEWQVDDATRFDFITYYYDGDRAFELGSPSYYGNNPNYVQATPRPMSVMAFQPQISHEYDLGEAQGELTFGLRYLQEDLERSTLRHFPDGTTTTTQHLTFDYYTFSAFLDNTFRFERLTVTPGVRFEYVDIDGQNRLDGSTADQDFTEVLPALSASYMLDDRWSVYGNAQASFMAPASNQIEISPLPQDISAQYAWVYEVGTRAELWNRLLSPDLTFYLIDYSDRIEPDPDQFDVFINAGRSRHQGVELALDSDLEAAGLKGLSLWSSVSYNHSQYENGEFAGNDLPGAPHWLASGGLRYEHEPSGLWTGFDGVFVDEAYSDPDNTTEINAAGTRGIRPSYTIWNAHVGLQRDVLESSRLRLQVSFRNIFDEDYFDIRAGRGIYPGAPFNVSFDVGFRHDF